MSTLNFEVGKAYRTRDGRKAVCLTTTLDNEYPIGVQVGVYLYIVTIEGYHLPSKAETKIDIISEWIDKPVIDWSTMPAWAKFVAMDSDGCWFWYEKEPFIGEVRWQCNSEYYDGIPTKYAPKWDGDWRNSLTERP
jgi:hypothetical protein